MNQADDGKRAVVRSFWREHELEEGDFVVLHGNQLAPFDKGEVELVTSRQDYLTMSLYD